MAGLGRANPTVGAASPAGNTGPRHICQPSRAIATAARSRAALNLLCQRFACWRTRSADTNWQVALAVSKWRKVTCGAPPLGRGSRVGCAWLPSRTVGLSTPEGGGLHDRDDQ